MANVAVKGFQPLRRLGGGSVTYKKGRVLTNNTTAIFRHDAVIVTTGGDYVVQATGTTFTASVADGAMYQGPNNQMIAGKYLPAATLYTSTGVAPANMSQIYVVDDPIDTVFMASVDTAIALTNLNLNHAITLTAGSTTTGLSGHELTSVGANVTATIPWRVRDFISSADTDPDAAHAHVECMVNAGMTEPAISLLLGT